MTKASKGLTAKDKSKIEKMLNEKLEELTKSLSAHDDQTTGELPKNAKEANPIKGEMEVIEALEKRESQEMLSIRNALLKLNSDDYGLCQACRGDIGIDRLMIRPWSTLCVPCKEKKEKEKA